LDADQERCASCLKEEVVEALGEEPRRGELWEVSAGFFTKSFVFLPNFCTKMVI